MSAVIHLWPLALLALVALVLADFVPTLLAGVSWT